MSAIDPITGRTPTYKVWTDSNTGQQVRPHPVGEPNAAAQIRDNVVRLQEMLQQESQRVADLLDAYQALCRALRYHHQLDDDEIDQLVAAGKTLGVIMKDDREEMPF